MEKRSFLHIVCFVLLHGVVCLIPPAQPPNGYISWVPQNSNRTDLFCPIRCNEAEKKEECCLCGALECWYINLSFCSLVLRPLHVEYTDINGTSRVLQIGLAANETIYVLKHTDGYLASFPINLNDYIDIIEIDFSWNRIKEIANISFLKALSVLVLDGNLLTYISNNTFIGLVRLRQVSLAQNLIRNVEPYSFITSEMSIFKVNISMNQLTDIDATLLAPPNGFCEIDVSKNKITNMNNPSDFSWNMSSKHGPGRVFLQHNHLNFPNLTEIGVLDWTDFGKNVLYNWDINFQTELKCDCIIFHYFKYIKLANLRRIFKNYDFLECSSPAHLVVNLTTLYDMGNYDDLICNITVDCPRHCHCYDQPSRSNVVVECEGKGLTELPEGPLPTGFWGNQRLELRMGNNSITKIVDKGYIDRIVSMDLTGNPISIIEDSAANAMNLYIELNLPDCKLQTLPSSFIYLDPNKINTGNNVFLCSCEIVWIENWQYKLSGNKKEYFCSNNGKIIPVREIEQNLHCKAQGDDLSTKIIPSSMVAIVACLLLMVACFYFRYEIRILFGRAISRMSQTKTYNPKVFISHDESETEILKWIKSDLYPCLCHEGVNTILPCRNFPPGVCKETLYKLAIRECNTYIVILSQDYNQKENLTENWTKVEFSYIWNECFNSGKTKLLIMVNFDQLRPAHYKDRRLRALCRVGNVLDFRQREEKMLIRIKNILNISQLREQPLQESLSIVTCEDIDDTVSERRRFVRRHDNRRTILPMRMEPQSIPTFEVTRRYQNSKSDRVANTTFRPS